MRLLLLSLTLTCFFLFPSEGDATTVCEKAAIKFTHNLSETGDENYSEYGNQTPIILLCHNVRKSFNQQRCAQDIQMGFSGPCFAPVEILAGAGSIEKNCFHCIPIALKLLFPEHYFW